MIPRYSFALLHLLYLRPMPLRVPGSLLEHPELKGRDIAIRHVVKPASLFLLRSHHPRLPLSYQGSVYEDDHTGSTPPNNVVKIIKEDSQSELDVYDYLLADINNPRNHTLPCEVIRGDVPILIMPHPRISAFEMKNYPDVYYCMYQILEVSSTSTPHQRTFTPSSWTGHRIHARSPCRPHGTHYTSYKSSPALL